MKGGGRKGQRTVKLVLDDVVEDLQQEKDEVVVGRTGVQEPWGAERLWKVKS